MPYYDYHAVNKQRIRAGELTGYHWEYMVILEDWGRGRIGFPDSGYRGKGPAL